MKPSAMHPTYLTPATIAKFCGMDRRTVSRRLSCAGLESDATLAEADGSCTGLWRKERLLDLIAAVGRIASVEDFQTMTSTTQTITSAPAERPADVFSLPPRPISK